MYKVVNGTQYYLRDKEGNFTKRDQVSGDHIIDVDWIDGLYGRMIGILDNKFWAKIAELQYIEDEPEPPVPEPEPQDDPIIGATLHHESGASTELIVK